MPDGYIAHRLTQDYGPAAIPEGEYFVMGDNRRSSLDSRDETVGTIPYGKIEGRARLIFWPLGRFGWIE